MKLNTARLANLHASMTGHVESGNIPGIVTLIGHGDEIHVDAIGMKRAGGKEPMQRDTIFRIASLTKPISAAATMMLADDDKLRLDDPVERWLPELATGKVPKSVGSQLDDTVPAKRSITVRDLLTSTFGFGSVMARPGTYPIGSGGYSWVLASGSLAPLTLSSGGLISGTPTAAGVRNFSLKITDSQAANSQTPCSITVTVALSTTCPIAAATVGVVYSAQVIGLGGSGGFSWSLASGSLAPMTLSTGGLVSGTPTAAVT